MEDAQTKRAVTAKVPLPIYEEDLDAEEALDEFLSWTQDRGIDLWQHQEDALLALAAGDHVILGTPTGSGKSMVALGLLYLCLSAGKVAYYTAPIKALVSEKFFDLVEIGRASCRDRVSSPV